MKQQQQQQKNDAEEIWSIFVVAAVVLVNNDTILRAILGKIGANGALISFPMPRVASPDNCRFQYHVMDWWPINNLE